MAFRFVAAFIAVLLVSPAVAQQVPLQAGSWVQGHVPIYATNGSQPTIMDGGGAAGGSYGTTPSELGITLQGAGTGPYANGGNGPLGTNICDYDGPTTGAYHYLCFSPNAQGGGLIAYGAGGGASQLPLYFNINGSTYQFPAILSGMSGPTTTTVGDFVLWNNGSGTVTKDGGTPGSMAFVNSPVPIANGGTGATTAVTALANLGGISSTTAVNAGTGLTGGGALTADVTLSLATPVAVSNGGTGASSAATARNSLGAAASGANGDITSLSALSTPLSVTQGGTGANSASAALANLAGAPLASPALTGTPTAPTASTGTNTTQIATTAFVQAQIAAIPATAIKVATIQDQETSGTNGTSVGSNSTTTCTLNTLSDPSGIGITLASNQFTVPAGTYEIVFSSPFFQASTAGTFQAQLYNVTSAVTAAYGSSVSISAATQANSIGTTIVTVASPTTYKVVMRNKTGGNIGDAASFGTEVYTQVAITKLQ